MAVVVAENIAGDEETFAEQMTRRARSLGMSRTVFRNASGLPDREQVTTARDLTILARAIQERFPRQFALFQTRNFQYAGRNHRNHNKLLGRVEGVDGIKTGFTRMSGFNLMTSAKADGRHIVSIVLGGRSGRHRDGIMANLVVAHLPRASTGPQRVMVAQARDEDERPARAVPPPTERAQPQQIARAEAPTPPAPVAQPAALQPRPQPRPIELAAVRPMAASASATAFAPPTQNSLSQQPMRWATGAQPASAREIRPAGQVQQANAAAPRPPAAVGVAVAAAQPEPVRVRPAAQPAAPTPGARAADVPRPPANVEYTSSVPKAAPARAEPPRSAWIIQLAATDDEARAKDILSSARSRTRTLPRPSLHRAGGARRRHPVPRRFAGFDDQAEADRACRELKRSGFSCFATRG